jgi:hypothetical protein
MEFEQKGVQKFRISVTNMAKVRQFIVLFNRYCAESIYTLLEITITIIILRGM